MLVVGGGIAGVSIAMSLAESASVLLVESEPQLGIHSTGRSAAMTNRTSGPLPVCALADRSRCFLERPPVGFSEVPLLHPRGLLWVGDRGTESLLETISAKAPECTKRVSQRTCRSLAPLLRKESCVAGGVHEPDAHSIDVAALLYGYRAGLLSRGGSIRTGAEAIEFHRREGRWNVTAGPLEVDCATVVNASGAWGDEVARRAGVRRLRLRTLRRTAVFVDAPVGVSSMPMVMDVQGRWYASPDTGGMLISSSDEIPDEPRDVHPEELDVALAIERIHEAFDMDLSHGVRRFWAGLRTFTEDRVPALGPDPDEPSFVWAVGQGGAGIKTAPAIAATIAEMILRGASIPEDLDVSRLRR